MKTKKAKGLSVLLVAAFVAAGLLAAVATAWPQPQPRSLQQKPAQVQVRQPAEKLPIGGGTEGALSFPE